MTPVTVLGLGPMGSALASAFAAEGHPTTVWNRTPGKAPAGTREVSSVRDAAGPLTIVCVIDYAAAAAILDPVALKGHTLVNLTADAPHRAREMAAWALSHGIDYLDGAIMTPVPTIGTPSGVVILSGPQEVYDRHAATLAAVGATTYLGAEIGRAAAFDVALLDFFWTSMTGLVHAFTLAASEGVPPAELAPFLQGIGAIMPPIIEEFAHHHTTGDHPGDASTIVSARAGMAHIAETADRHGLDATVLRAALGLADEAIESGRGSRSYSALI
ncbi:NAD(P)-dependent oxidoreductase [Herbidospora mongoliensis]|uniref:NAD(P)-dependent oxidoreductase n=1 Tax=Herbidospora mongoliensis TaxID=688067 RepID=UPI0008371871|nr:NAD(P)-binding domain-containing protein [Herbidospora mongoliensis]